MIKVQVRPNEPLEAALRRFKRQCNYAGIFRLAKSHAYHEKRSDKARREGRERIRTIQRAMRKLEGRGGSKRARRKSKVKGGQPKAEDQNPESQTSALTAVTTVAAPATPAAPAPAATSPTEGGEAKS